MSFISFIQKLFGLNPQTEDAQAENMAKYLIVGLGNIGDEYANTRHNIGFKIIDAFAQSVGATWEDKRYGAVSKCRVKNAELVLLKPSTYMNLSGQAVRYWLQQEKIPIENLFVLVDDLNIPFGTIRMRKQGSAGGHNGLKNIEQLLCTPNYARLRFGIGNDFGRGAQVGYVLGEWTAEENAAFPDRLTLTTDIIKSFCLQGIDRTMNQYNGK